MNAKLGLQLSTITEYIDTAEHIKASLDKVAEIGFKSVQLQGVPLSVKDSDIASALKSSGLNCVATQEDYVFGFGDDPERAISRAVTVGSKYLAMALIPWEVDSPESIKAFAPKMCEINELVRKAGLVFSFHPIGPDYRLIEGVPAYKRLMAELPKDVGLTFCVSASFESVDSVSSVLKEFHPELVHFKDGITLPDGTNQLMPLGEGEHDWKPILADCEENGVKYVFAEQERWNRDAFDCVAASYRYLKSLGL